MKTEIHRIAPPYFGLPKPLVSKELRITDNELFSSLDLKGPVAHIKEHVEKQDYVSAAVDLVSYMIAGDNESLPNHRLVRPMPEKKLLEEGDSIIQHKIRAWGTRRTSFGKKIDFTAFAKEHRLQEFHRLNFLAYLAAAYRSVKAPKYVIAFENIVTQWIEQLEKVPPTSTAHPIWNDSICGTRVITLVDAYNEMKNSGEFSTRFHTMILKIILASARWLYRAQDQYYPGSAGFDACAALVLVGTYFPEFNESEEWLKRGLKRIGEKISKEYSKDGAYMEKSDAYMLKVLDRLVYVFEILKQKKLTRKLPAGYEKKVVIFAEYFAKTCTPLGTTNSFNDSAYIDITGRLLTWAEIFKRWDLIYPLQEILPPDLSKKAEKPSWDPSLNMPRAGRCVMRDDWAKKSLYMAVEYSPKDIHSHCETTNFVMFAYGRPMIIDRGRGTTYDDPYHLFLRTSRLHTMVTIDDDNIDLSKKQAEVIFWQSGRHFDCLSLAHDGYKKKFNADVLRTIVFVKPHYWIISDAVLKPKRTVKAISYIHTLPILVVREDGNIECKHGPGFMLVQPHGEKEEFLKERAIANMAYFDMDALWTDWVGFKKRAKIKKGATFFNIICPYENVPPDISVIRIDALPLRGGKSVEPTIAESFEILTPDGTDIFFISHGKPVKRRYGPVTSDARLGILRLDSSGKPRSHLLINSTTLEYNRKALHKTGKPASFTEKIFTRSKK